MATVPARRTGDANRFDFTTTDAIVTIDNPETGNRRTLRIVTQGPDARFAPGERLAEVLNDPEGDDWQTFAFVGQRGINVWKRLQGPRFEAYARMLENPPRFAARGFIYHVEPL